MSIIWKIDVLRIISGFTLNFTCEKLKKFFVSKIEKDICILFYDFWNFLFLKFYKFHISGILISRISGNINAQHLNEKKAAIK